MRICGRAVRPSRSLQTHVSETLKASHGKYWIATQSVSHRHIPATPLLNMLIFSHI